MRVRGLELEGRWSTAEVTELQRFLSPLPARWLEENPNLRAIVRRPVLEDAPPSAPGHSKYEPAGGAIVVYDKGVYDGDRIDPEQFRRSVFHELAHTIVRTNPRLLAAWTASTDGAGFVDEYAKTSPEEDFADTFSEYLIDSAATRKAVPPKAEFLRCMIEQSNQPQEKSAMPMNFMHGFQDELVKVASPGVGRLARMMRFGKPAAAAAPSAGRGIAKMLALGGGAAVGGR